MVNSREMKDQRGVSYHFFQFVSQNNPSLTKSYKKKRDD